MASRAFRHFFRDDRGMETVEWVVLGALIVAGLAAVLGGIRANLLHQLTTLQTATS
jgi:Flp pilus assembly pilin Flp